MNLAIDTFTKERFGIVTGSRCSPLVPKKDAKLGMITLAKELAIEVVFKFYDEVSTWQMEHGQLGEHFAMQHYKDYFDNSIVEGRWINKVNYGGNTDAEAIDYGVDFKCQTTLKGWTDTLVDEVKDTYQNQAQLYMLLTKKDRWVIANYLIETQKMTDYGLVYPVKEKDRMILQEVKASEEWRDKFLSNLPFVISKRDEFIEILKTKFEL